MALEFDINLNPPTDRRQEDLFEKEQIIKEVAKHSGAPEEEIRATFELTEEVKSLLDGHTGVEIASVVLSVIGDCIHHNLFGKKLTASLAQGILQFIQEKYDD